MQRAPIVPNEDVARLAGIDDAIDGVAPVRQLGQANLQDPAHWQRGVELLRIAARGLPRQAVASFVQLAQAYDKAGDLVEKSKGAGLETWYYAYDTLNRLTSIEQTSNRT